MEYAIDYLNAPTSPHPGDWAEKRESEGWAALGCGDHITLGTQWALHSFPTLAMMAARTSRVMLATAFANNLLRSPVEFAQFALTLQEYSNGRFEAGIGAGWSSVYIEGSGMVFPRPAERARRLREAVLIIRELFNGGTHFTGEFYNIALPHDGPFRTPPPIYASLGGEWTIRNIAPLVDRVEIFPQGAAARSGTMDRAAQAAVTRDDVRRLIALARSVNPNAAIGVGMFTAAGDDPRVVSRAAEIRGTFAGEFFGPGDQVAEALRSLADEGIDRVNVLAGIPSTAEALAPHLFSNLTVGST